MRVDTDELRRIASGLAECARLEAEIHELGRRGLQRQLHPAAAGRALRPARADARTQDQDRILHRRPDPGEAARPAPVVETLLRYREVEKLRSTYGEGLLAEVAPDGRIHATFNQTVARTGRLSSDRAQPPQHPGAHRGGAAVPARRSSPPRAAGSWWPTTTRSSCGSSPTCREDPGLDRRLRRGTRHPPDHGRPRCSASTRTR